MSLSSDLISQFVKITNDAKNETEKETTVCGTVDRIQRDAKGKNPVAYVRFDGSPDIFTPAAIVINASKGDRVVVTIKKHSATITSNMTSPAANQSDVYGSTPTPVPPDPDEDSSMLGGDNVYDSLFVPGSVTTGTVSADIANLTKILADEATINELLATHIESEEIEAKKLTVLDLIATAATIDKLIAKGISVESLIASSAEIDELITKGLTVRGLIKANAASIEDLETNKLSAESADIKYAKIDFTNIGDAAMEYLYSRSGLIESVVINDGSITGRLVGVTIKGDTIEANTLVADKLVIQGEDGLYYKLNTNGVTTEAEQTEYNSLNGSILTAKSVTAEKVNVSDLVAFDATIGGFTIGADSIHSEVKDGEGNTTRGIYMDTDGQFNFGDASNFVKYYRDDDGNYKLAISADDILYLVGDQRKSIGELGALSEYVKIGTYHNADTNNDEPCIELGESDSDFKLIITNTRILFTEGTSVPAYINNQSLHISKAVVEEELQQGEFVWKIRSNGNLGLMWRGVSS